MRTIVLSACLALVFSSMNKSCLAQDSGLDSAKPYRSPERFEKAIQRFEAADQQQPPPQGAIVCIGSSSMRFWHETIAVDLAPLTIIPRGFGGSNMNDALHYADRIVLPYSPRAIVVYEGDNDVAQGVSPEQILSTLRKFVDKVHTRFPECRIYFLSVKPSIKRWHLWSRMQEVNRLIAAECAKDKRLAFVDVATGMLNAEGEPIKNLFKKDDLHMTEEGYVVWKDALRPVLMDAELRYESKKPAE
ncbi:MAG: hypothetical protein KJN67_04790 [Pontiella sp.]|nr:hypothetical protein [Pontiella sp.]